MACGPDVIFIGGWLAGSYDALSQIAPVVYLATDSDLGVVESVRQNTRAIASLVRPGGHGRRTHDRL